MYRYLFATLIMVVVIFSLCGCNKKEKESVVEGEGTTTGGMEETTNIEGEEQVVLEYEGLVGLWEGVEKGDANSRYDWTFAFDGEVFRCESTLGEFYKGKLERNDGIEPNELDMHIEESVDGEYDGLTALGIYQYEDGVLKIALNEPGDEERAREFSTERGARIWTLKRVE